MTLPPPPKSSSSQSSNHLTQANYLTQANHLTSHIAHIVQANTNPMKGHELSPFTVIIDHKIVVTYNHQTKRFTISSNEDNPLTIDDENILASFIMDILDNNFKLCELYRLDKKKLGIDPTIRILGNEFLIGEFSFETKHKILVKYLTYAKHTYGF